MYADHAATSWPVLFPASTDAWANASSAHRLGRRARDATDRARRTIAQALRLPLVGTPDQHVLFTSGGTESNNWILRQRAWQLIVTAATEHHAVFMPAQSRAETGDCRVVFLAPDGMGRISPASVAQALGQLPPRGPALVSLAYVNNEVGSVTDMRAVADVVRRANEGRAAEHRVWLHTDAVQAPGHVAVDMGPDGALAGVDALTLSAHKFYGPTGVGVLVCRAPAPSLEPLLFGGHQQRGLRPGTEPVAAVVAMAAALQDATDPARFEGRRAALAAMTALVWDVLLPFVVSGLVLPTGPLPGAERAPHHVSFCVRGATRADLVERLDSGGGVLASGGSACTSDSGLPSHVLAAMGVPDAYIHGSLRISLGHTNTLEEVRATLCPALRRLLGDLQQRAPAV